MKQKIKVRWPGKCCAIAADVPFSHNRFKQMYISWDCSGAAQKRKRAQNSFLAKVGAKVHDHLPSRQTRITFYNT
jgi:hypothetical protein